MSTCDQLHPFALSKISQSSGLQSLVLLTAAILVHGQEMVADLFFCYSLDSDKKIH